MKHVEIYTGVESCLYYIGKLLQSKAIWSLILPGVHKYISKGGLLTLIQCLLSFETDTISSVFAQDKEETLAMMHVDTSEAKATS